MLPKLFSSSSTISAHHQDEQRKHRGDDIHINLHQIPILRPGCFETILPSAKANLREVVQCCLEFLTMEVSHVWYEPVPERSLDCWSLIRVTERSIWRAHYSGPVPCLLVTLMDCAISQTRSLNSLSISCVVKPPLSCQITIVSPAHWLTPIPAFSNQTQTWRVGIWIVLASGMTDSGNQQTSHYILGSQLCSMIQWWISNACYSKQASGVLNILTRVMQCTSRGEVGVPKVLEIVSKVGRQCD